MKRTGLAILMAGIMALGISGCAHKSQVKDLPVYKDVLTYDLPYDLTYLRTIEALELVPDWALAETDKEKGIIRVRNTNFSAFDDSDQREATFLVQRVSPEQTSVSLASYSQQVIGGGDLLKRVDERLRAEKKATPPTAQ